MFLKTGIVSKFTHIETKARSRISSFFHRENYIEMLYFRTYVNSLFTVCVIVAAVYLNSVSQVTLNIRIAVELNLILAVLVECKTIVIELVGPFLDTDHLAVKLQFAFIIDGHKTVATLKICMPFMTLAGKITVLDHIETHDRRYSF